ncbi:MAG: Rid family detoxifying hydrolase [Deferribacterota bacterium]|nr:Rid family detoxifying hydrolase [Deferribacterota bacterium]
MQYINTKDAPAAIGAYSQAVDTGNMLFVSGQIPINPKSGKIDSLDIKGQTEQVLRNLFNIIKAAKYGLTDIAKITIYITDINNFNIVNKIYEDYLGSHRPARALVSVDALPKGSLIEIDAICFRQ